MTGWDYGNARVAALRSRLLDAAALRRLGDAESTAAFLSLLAAFDDWRPFLAPVPGIEGEPGTGGERGARRGARDFDPGARLRHARMLDGAIERHRSTRLSALLRWYVPPVRQLVEAVVMPLDLERALSMLRLRRAGQEPWPTSPGEGTPPGTATPRGTGALPRAGTPDGDGTFAGDAVLRGIPPGALLDAGRLVLLSRATGEGGPFRELARLEVIGSGDAARLARDAERGTPPEQLEASLHEAWDRAREARAQDAGEDGRLVLDEIGRERSDRLAVRDMLRSAGLDDAARLERHLALGRMARLGRRARREPLGVAPVVGYRAALEHQALQLRAAMARPAAAWDVDRAASFVAAG